MAADGGCERDVVRQINEGYIAWGALKSVPRNRGLGIKVKKCLCERVFVPTALYRAAAWGMRSAERRSVREVWLESHDLMELGMKRCAGELE